MNYPLDEQNVMGQLASLGYKKYLSLRIIKVYSISGA
jgi:hypothetical protein